MIRYVDYLNNKEKYQLIDVRAPETIAVTGSIEGATCIFKGDLFANYAKYLNKETHYIVYCGSGNSAGMLEALLTKNGYLVDSLEGGFKGYLSFMEE